VEPLGFTDEAREQSWEGKEGSKGGPKRNLYTEAVHGRLIGYTSSLAD